MDPNSVPISEALVDTNGLYVTEFTIGNDDDWLVEWKEIGSEVPPKLSINGNVGTKMPSFIENSRSGWYVNPDPLHNLSRKMILPVVSLLIVSLFIHAIEPGLVDLGIFDNTIAGSISIGPLDYPRLLFFTFPIFLLPLLFRTIANFRDMSRQSYINSDPFVDPMTEITVSKNGCKLSIPSYPEELELVRSRVQVGIAIPERSTVLASLGRNEGGQPSPGMSTKLPDKRIAAGDESGTGVGEATPMQVSTRRSVILEPFRIMETGDWSVIQTKENKPIVDLDLNIPIKWPGTIYSSLIAVHWEILIEFKDSLGREVKWVSPFVMPQSEEPTSLNIAPVRSGRAELSNY